MTGHAILTIEANNDTAPYHGRQMPVLRRDDRLAWLDMTRPEEDVLCALPAGSFQVSRLRHGRRHAELAY